MAINVQWDQKFEIGHDRIDFQHRIFLGLIRELSDLIDQNPDWRRIDRALREVYKYAEFHFLSEENVMEDIDYPQLGDHRRHHAILLAELSDIMVSIRHGKKAGQPIVDFLFQWFALHTSQEDRRIADFLLAEARRPKP